MNIDENKEQSIISKEENENNDKIQEILSNKFRESAGGFYISELTQSQTKTLNVDKIKDLDDVKRILKFLNITAIDNGVVRCNGFEEVKDLFEY